MTASDSDELAKRLAEAFSESDPLAVAAGVTAYEFEAFVRVLCRRAIHEGLTIVARSALVGEFEIVRLALETLFRSLPAEAWDRRGVASNETFTVRAFAYLAEGHVRHHLKILRERYLPA